MSNKIIEDFLSLLAKSQEEKLKGQAMELPSLPEALGMQEVEYIKHFADAMPGGFFIYHADGNEELIYANKAMLRIFNCATMEEFQEWTGNSFRGIVHPDDLEAVEQSIQKQIASSQYDLDYVEYRIIQKGGKVCWIEDYGHFVHSESVGDIFYVFVGDATEKKRRELAEKEEIKVIHQEHLRRLEVIEGLSVDYESIFYVNLDNDQMKAYRISSGFQKQFRKARKVCAFAGFDTEYVKTFVHPDDRKLLAGVSNPEYIREKLSQAKTFHVNYRTLQGEESTYMQLRVVNVGKEGHVSQIVMGYRNVDDEIRQEMEQKQLLQEALDKANMANNVKNLFLSNMSHDIRTPMNAIVGFTALAKQHLEDKTKLSSDLNMISNSSSQLLKQLNNVLEIARIESRTISLEEDDCSLSAILHEVQSELFSKAQEKSITLSLDIADLEHDAVCADQQKLSQILTCLVNNAIQYTKKGGHIQMTAMEHKERQKDYATYQFEVEDNGIGIDKKFVGHVFEPFEREKNTTLSGIYGTGLGLAITKGFVEMMGGSIEVTSAAGKGSKFTVKLPLQIREEQKAQPEEAEDAPPLFSSPKKILVVDDNEINLEIEHEVLNYAGFLVDTAMDGSIAVEKVRKSQPGDYDLILMDIQMPVMDGYLATKTIRSLEDLALAHIPIIAVSANAFDEDKKKAIESGMNAHLAKPLDTPKLYKLLRQFLQES